MLLSWPVNTLYPLGVMADSPTSGTVLSWNFANWFTVVLMGLLFFGLAGAAQKWYQSRNQNA